MSPIHAPSHTSSHTSSQTPSQIFSHALTQPSAATRPVRRRLQRGVTVLESLVVMTTAALTLGSALPGLQQARAQRHLDGSAAQLETDIQFARSLAVAKRHNLRMSFVQDVHGSCYVLHSGPSGSCTCTATGETVCNAGSTAERSQRFDSTAPVQLRANVGGIVFDADKGTITPTTTMRLAASDGRAVHVVVNLMGRVRNCTPAGPQAVPGYKTC